MNEPQDPNQTADIPSALADSLDAGLAAGFGKPTPPRSTLGDMRPVLLKEAEGESAHIVKPQSDAMPSAAETGTRYQLSGEIARGGMGAVLRGRDVDLGRDLAVKVLLEKHANRPEVARRFIEEAQIGGQLQHPGVVPVYDIGRFGDRPFFTMKLVKGLTLAAILTERMKEEGGRMNKTGAGTDSSFRLPPSSFAADRPRLLGIALQVCQTLAYAHAKGVIHRDLKPANIMVGAFGEVQVMDWGLAKVLAEGGIADEEKASRERQRPEGTLIRTARSTGSAGSFGTDTEAGSLLGTPAYMPPEQANGDIANLDRRADVFGLGAILCEILTGKPPYVGRSHEEVRRSACNGDLADASARLDGCGADVELISLTKSCLSPEAVDRPKDAQAVADGLTAYLDGVQDRLRQAELAEAEARAKAVEEAKRRRLTLALAATVLLAVTLGGGGWLWVKVDRDARQAQVSRDVNDALNRATAWREQAKAATVGGAALFAQAREQAQRALALVESGPADDQLKKQVRALQAELDEEEKDRKLVMALEEARLAQAETVAGGNRFASERAVPKFREAFAAYGLTAGESDPAAAAKRIRQRPAAIQAAIFASLDEWDDLAHVVNEPHREWLQKVLAAAEPEDDWGRQVRAARADLDNARRRAALHQLAESADVKKVPARALTRLALRLAPAAQVALLRRALAQYPGDVWVNQGLGVALQESFDPPQYGEAVRYMTAAVALCPDSAGTRFNLGNALRGKGQLDEAIACFRKAIELNRKYTAAYNNLGLALVDKGRTDEAIAFYQKAIELNPKDAAVRNSLGNALQNKGQVHKAIVSYKKAIELEPKYAATHISLGIILCDVKRDYDGAILCFQKAIALNRKDAKVYSNLGVALMGKGLLDEAIACYRKAIEHNPKLPRVHQALGDALAAKGQVGEAISCHKKAIALDPNYAAAHNGLGAILCDVKRDYDGAIACFRKAIALDAKNAKAHMNLGVALTAKGELDKAIACFRKAIALDPKHANAHANLGNALLSKNQLDEAISSYKKAIALDPKDAKARFILGNALFHGGQVDKAIVCYKKAIELEPNYAVAYSRLGAILCEVKRDYQGAIACFCKTLTLDPKDATSHYNLGNALYGLGRVDEASNCWRKAIELNAKYAEAHCNLGNALKDNGQVDEAIACFHKAIALDPKLANAHSNLGNALAGQGQVDKAIACFRKVIALQPKDAIAHGVLGQALLEQGRYAEAKDALERALALLPERHPLRAHAAELVKDCQRFLTLAKRLPRLLHGKDKAKSAQENLDFARMCNHQRLHVAATRFAAEAFAADPKRADNLGTGHRYQAACSAALAAAGLGKDAGKLGNKERTHLRKQALGWLRGDLNLRRKQLENGQPGERAAVQQTMRHWQKDTDLAGIRDQATLAKLPADEQKAFAQLWRDVAALLKKAEGKAK